MKIYSLVELSFFMAYKITRDPRISEGRFILKRNELLELERRFMDRKILVDMILQDEEDEQ